MVSERFSDSHSHRTASRQSAAIATIVSCSVLHTVYNKSCVHRPCMAGNHIDHKGHTCWSHCMFLLFLATCIAKYCNTPACYETSIDNMSDSDRCCQLQSQLCKVAVFCRAQHTCEVSSTHRLRLQGLVLPGRHSGLVHDGCRITGIQWRSLPAQSSTWISIQMGSEVRIIGHV